MGHIKNSHQVIELTYHVHAGRMAGSLAKLADQSQALINIAAEQSVAGTIDDCSCTVNMLIVDEK